MITFLWDAVLRPSDELETTPQLSLLYFELSVEVVIDSLQALPVNHPFLHQGLEEGLYTDAK